MLPVVSALVAALLLVVIGAWAVQQDQRTVKRDAATRVRSNADSAVRALVRQSQDYVRTVQAGAANPVIVAALSAPGPATQSAAQEPLAMLANGKNSPAAGLTDVRGRYVTGYPLRKPLLGESFAFRDWFRGASESGRPYVSAGYRSSGTGHPLVVGVTAPVDDQGRRVGYLTMPWQLASVRSVVHGSLRDDGVTVTITDQRGQPLTTSLEVDDRGQPTAAEVPPLTRRALAGERVSTTEGGNLVEAGRVPGLGWTVTATFPLSTAMEPARAFRSSLLLALGVSLLVLFGALSYTVLVTRRQEVQRALVTAQSDHLSALFATSPIGIIEGRPDGTILAANSALARMLDYSVDELMSMRADDLAHPSSASDVTGHQGILHDAAAGSSIERVLRSRSGAPVPVLVSVVVLRDRTGAIARTVAFAADLTGLRATEAALQVSEERFRKIFDEGLIGKAIVTEDGVILHANQALASMLGVAADELQGTLLTSCFGEQQDRDDVDEVVGSGEGDVHAELLLQGSRGEERWGRVAVHWVQDQHADRVLLAEVEDVTARRIAEQRLRELALHDDLTGLPNRRLLMERFDQVFAIARSGRSGTSVTALFIDLDGFKAVNDRAGHPAGDRLLKNIATDLVGTVRPADTVARVGGDEFVVLLGSDEGLETVRVVADRLSKMVRRQVPCEDTPLTVSASIGIARVDLLVEPEVVPEQLLRRADAAMYRAKQRGRDRQDVFDTELEASTEVRYRLEHAVRGGLAHDRIELVYQAVVDLDTCAVLGAEALMRLHDQDGHLLPTLPAIMAAEQAGLAQEVGDRVLDLALATLGTWPTHMTVAVNVSARELTGDGFRQRVEAALRRHGVDPARLVLEITESSILHAGRSSLGALQALRERGVRVAIDDFGTAYATLANLTVLPVDLLKVDASFTSGLTSNRAAAAVIHGVITMADAMGVPCIVEGIETQAQHDALLGLGVRGQGWLWGKPKGRETTPSVSSPRVDFTDVSVVTLPGASLASGSRPGPVPDRAGRG